jgi:hypothetical protein
METRSAQMAQAPNDHEPRTSHSHLGRGVRSDFAAREDVVRDVVRVRVGDRPARGPSGPCSPCGPRSPCSPCGPVAPASPLSPLSPLGPSVPCTPCGPPGSTRSAAPTTCRRPSRNRSRAVGLHSSGSTRRSRLRRESPPRRCRSRAPWTSAPAEATSTSPRFIGLPPSVPVGHLRGSHPARPRIRGNPRTLLSRRQRACAPVRCASGRRACGRSGSARIRRCGRRRRGSPRPPCSSCPPRRARRSAVRSA